jgi:hypothetical protein
MYIESPGNEIEEQFRAYVTELLTSIYGRVPEWAGFRAGRRIERRGMFYRELVCPAGSVRCQISVRAQQPIGISRAIILQGQVDDAPHCWEVRSGAETEFAYDEIQAA